MASGDVCAQDDEGDAGDVDEAGVGGMDGDGLDWDGVGRIGEEAVVCTERDLKVCCHFLALVML